MNCSFQPSGKWFIFDTSTGETLKKDLPTKASALVWMAKHEKPDKIPA
jgi:hypothetical protein